MHKGRVVEIEDAGSESTVSMVPPAKQAPPVWTYCIDGYLWHLVSLWHSKCLNV